MIQKQEYDFKPIREFGKLTAFRNLRLFSDELQLTVDCVPPETHEVLTIDEDEASILSDLIDHTTKEITESNKALRLYFAPIVALTVHEEFVEHPFIEYQDCVAQQNDWFPLLKAKNSAWTASIAEHDLPPGDTIDHFRIFSMTTYIDVLAELVSGEWVKNQPPTGIPK